MNALHEPNTPTSTIKIIIADNNLVFRNSLTGLFGTQAGFEVVKEVASLSEAAHTQITADIIIAELELPVSTSLTALHKINSQVPKPKVLILSELRDGPFVLSLVKTGIYGYLDKGTEFGQIAEAVSSIIKGTAVFSPEVSRSLLNKAIQTPSTDDCSGNKLTPRETEVLILIAEGFSNKEIANQLTIGVRTVETHRERVMRKLDIHDIAGLTRYCISKGLVSL